MFSVMRRVRFLALAFLGFAVMWAGVVKKAGLEPN